MHLLNLYFIVIYRFSRVTLHKNSSDSKFSALLCTSLLSCFILTFLSIAFCIILNKDMLIGVTVSMLKLYSMALGTLTLILNYLWFYHINDVAYLEEEYLEYSLKKRKVIGALVVLGSLAVFLSGLLFVNKKVFPDL